MTTPHFNLIDEQWIPVGGEGLVSLKEVFSRQDFKALGGNPVQKIALLKLLLAIAQAACTPKDANAWKDMTPHSLGQACLKYLEKWHDAFWLYGEKPFLQMPGIAKAERKSCGALQPQISTGNTTILFESQEESLLLDHDKALLLLTTASFGLGGKKTDNKVVLSPGYALKFNEKGKPATGKPGACLGFLGFQHHFLLGNTLLETVLFNLFSKQDLHSLPAFLKGLGSPPWEKMPQGEDCPVAQELKQSLLGRLVPLSKFMLFVANGVHYTDGIIHPAHLEGGIDPSVAYNTAGKKVTVLWANPEKQPWRDLTALLSFIVEQQGFTSLQLNKTLPRMKLSDYTSIGIWAGGLKVSSNAGEQYASGTDDFVESSVYLDKRILETLGFDALKVEMAVLENMGKHVYGSVMGYYKEQKCDGANYAKRASHTFWQLCEVRFQGLLDACAEQKGQTLRPGFAACARQAYDTVCPKDTAKQLTAWAKCQPKLGKYLNS